MEKVKKVERPVIKKQMKINKTKKKIDFKELLKYKKVLIAGAILLIVIITIIVMIVNILTRTKYDPYYEYEQKMNDFGYYKLYNNETVNTTEKVTRIEAVKMAVAAALNITDISDYMYEELNIYPDDLWGEYAESVGILGDFDINAENFNDEIDYITALTYFKNAKDKLLPEKGAKDFDKNIKDLKEYSLNEQRAIKDLLGYEIIKENTSDINGKDIAFKGQINELVVNFVLNLNTITLSKEDKLNINPDNVPSNVKDFPYILANVNKSIYELPFKENPMFESSTPIQIFSEFNDNLSQISRFAQEYFKSMLNVDYKTIDAKTYKDNLDFYVLKDFDLSEIEKYVKYVKDNEIVIKTDVRVINPTIYFDGSSYRIRIELNMEVVNSKTKENILLGDNNIVYNDKNYLVYVDYELESSGFNDTIYLDFDMLYNTIVNEVNIKNNVK